VAHVGDSAVVASQAPDRSLLFYRQTIGERHWRREQLAGPGSILAPPSVARVGHSSAIAALGPDKSLQFYRQHIGERHWRQEQVTGPQPQAPGDLTTYAPVVTHVGDSSVIAAQGPGFCGGPYRLPSLYGERVVSSGATRCQMRTGDQVARADRPLLV
jgi:hypothetical protein